MRCASILLLTFLCASCVHTEDKRSSALKFVISKLNEHGEIWEYQSAPPKHVMGADAEWRREYQGYLKENDPKLLQTILGNHASAKYQAVFLFRNRAGTVYKVVHYSEREDRACKDIREIDFRNYKVDKDDRTRGVVSGTVLEIGGCPDVY